MLGAAIPAASAAADFKTRRRDDAMVREEATIFPPDFCPSLF
jgi:hypothetical protein